jgi:alpha-galactosidase
MQVDFESASGRFTFIPDGLNVGSLHGASAWVSYRQQESGKLQRITFARWSSTDNEVTFSDVHGKGIQQIIHCPAGAEGIELIYRVNRYESLPFILLQMMIKNMSHAPVYLSECCLLDVKPEAGGELDLDRAEHGLRLLKVGWHGWDYTGVRSGTDRNSGGLISRMTSLSYTNPSTRRLSAKGEFASEGWTILATEACCLVTGFVSMENQFGQVYSRIYEDKAACSLVTQMDGIRLDPGEECDSEWGFVQFVRLPNLEPHADYIAAVARQMQARVPPGSPPAMWTHWYQYFHDISEQRLLSTLDGLLENQEVFPCRVVELDDGYQQAWGDWTTTNSKFPHGLPWLAEEVRKKGFIPGLWLAPFAVQSKSDLAKAHPDWLAKNERGKPASAGFLYNMFIHPLDLTHPGVLKHLRDLAHQLAQEWGYGMLKIDFLNAGAVPGRRANHKMTRAQALRQGLAAIREGAGEKTFVLGCGCPFGPAIGIVDAMRISPDTAPSWTPYFHWLEWASPLLKSNPNMPALRNAFRNTLNLSSLHQKWWWNDPDCLLVREGGSKLTEAEVRSQITLVGLSGGLVVSSDDLRMVSADRLKWMSWLVPNLGLRAEALDLLDNVMPGVYRVHVENHNQTWQLVGLFNWTDQEADLCLKYSQLGYKPGIRLHVFDFWNEKYQQTNEDEIVFANVPPHGCKFLRVCEMGSVPQVVGDTLHISMGMEIQSLRIVNGAVEVNLIEMGRKVDGKLWVWQGERVEEIKMK